MVHADAERERVVANFLLVEGMMVDPVDFQLWGYWRLSLVESHVAIFPSFCSVLPYQREKELSIVRVLLDEDRFIAFFRLFVD